MSKDVSVFLVLLCTLAAWIWAWKIVAGLWVARRINRFIAHLLGAFLGMGAAAGAFCLSGAFLMPGADDGRSVAPGVAGALILLMYIGLHLLGKKEAQGSAIAPAEAALLPAIAEPVVDAAPVPACAPRKSFSESIKAWRREEKPRPDEFLRHKERKRAAREKALGMSFSDFFTARVGDHLISWIGVLFLAGMGGLFVSLSSVGNWVMPLVASFFIVSLLVAVCFFIVPPMLLFMLLFLALLPFACVSAFVEAWWRIRHNEPFVVPPVPVNYANSIPLAPSPPPPPTPHPSSGGWLVPLVIGLWIGGSWGKDD
jgi:hypothetical protein